MVLGNHQAGKMVLARLMEITDLVPACTCWLGGEGVNRGVMASASIYILGKMYPYSYAHSWPSPWSQSVLFLPIMFLVLFKLLPPHWTADQVSLWVSKSVHGLHKRKAWTPVDLYLTQMQSMLVFTASYYGDFSSWHWCPRLRTWVWNWNPTCSSGGISTAKIVNCHIKSPSLLLVFLCGFFFISFVMVMGLLFSWSSGVTDGCLVILVWSWEDMSTPFAYSAILTGSLLITLIRD